MRRSSRIVVACALILVAATAGAASPAGVFIDDLTWTELRAEIASGKTTILVPIGGTEQNGPHMTLGKHNVRAAALAQKIAQALGSALVAPTLAYVPEGGVNPPTAHMRFPGSMTLPPPMVSMVVPSSRTIIFAPLLRGVDPEESRTVSTANDWPCSINSASRR